MVCFREVVPPGLIRNINRNGEDRGVYGLVYGQKGFLALYYKRSHPVILLKRFDLNTDMEILH